MIAELTDADLLSRMRNFEDHFVERKTSGDKRDWVKTTVAFANSSPIGYPCVLYVGVKDSGEIETPQVNLDSLQKSFNHELAKIYPRVPYLPKIIGENGRQALAVIILGSELRPHFAGPSFVRRGSVTVEASGDEYAALIASHNSKANKILAFKNKPVTVVNRQRTASQTLFESNWPDNATVADCNEFWVTLQQAPGNKRRSFPLGRVDLNFDDEKERLRLEINS